MNKTDVLRLAQLARIAISDKEAENLTREFESILNYVSDLKVAINNKQPTIDNKGKKNFPNKNVMREDSRPHESGIHTEDLLASAPAKEGDYIKVKKIL